MIPVNFEDFEEKNGKMCGAYGRSCLTLGNRHAWTSSCWIASRRRRAFCLKRSVDEVCVGTATVTNGGKGGFVTVRDTPTQFSSVTTTVSNRGAAVSTRHVAKAEQPQRALCGKPEM